MNRPPLLLVLALLPNLACAELDAPPDGVVDPDDPDVSESTSELSSALRPRRIARIVGTVLQVREGDTLTAPPNAGYATLDDHAAEVVMSQDRIVLRTTTGAVWAKDGALASAWVPLAGAGAASELAVAGELIAIRTPAGAIRVKEGALGSPWTTYVAAGATQVEVAACGYTTGWTAADVTARCRARARVAYVDGAGVARLRARGGDGVSTAWSVVASNVAELRLAGDAVAIRTRAGAFLKKEGAEGWTTLVAAGVTRIALSGGGLGYTLFAYARGNGDVLAQLDRAGPFTVHASGGASELATGARLAFRRGDGALLARQRTPNTATSGASWGPWQSQGTGAHIALSRSCVVNFDPVSAAHGTPAYYQFCE